MEKTIIKNPVKPKVILSEELKEKISEVECLQGQVVVHCTFKNIYSWACPIRIWKTTFLCARNSEHKSKLQHAENISLYPRYTHVAPSKTHHFTLIFSALPKDCSHFDLIEEIPEPGEFRVSNISRNKSDVYHLSIT